MTAAYNEKPWSDVRDDRMPTTNAPAYDAEEKIPATPPSPQSTDPREAFDDKDLASPPSSPDLEPGAISAALPAKLSGRQLRFHHAGFPWRSVAVTSLSDHQPAYYASVSEATPKKPDLLLRRPDRNGAGVGRSHFRLSRSMRVGVGSDDLDTEWTELKSSAVFAKGAYDFVFHGRRYRLQRTRARENGVEGVMQKVNLGHFKVVDLSAAAEGGEVVAVYVSETYHPMRMIGTLTLKEGVPAPLEVLIVLGVVGWREKMRRRAAYSGNAGNSGGG